MGRGKAHPKRRRSTRRGEEQDDTSESQTGQRRSALSRAKARVSGCGNAKRGLTAHMREQPRGKWGPWEHEAFLLAEIAAGQSPEG